mmetsp:Transcript_3368/g.12633  ORF Transcript_3368/g.12633 Transcript_3368/m.12633 type:complete len:254 (-) Transcript_3368:373-1134(-)
MCLGCWRTHAVLGAIGCSEPGVQVDEIVQAVGHSRARTVALGGPVSVLAQDLQRPDTLWQLLASLRPRRLCRSHSLSRRSCATLAAARPSRVLGRRRASRGKSFRHHSAMASLCSTARAAHRPYVVRPIAAGTIATEAPRALNDALPPSPRFQQVGIGQVGDKQLLTCLHGCQDQQTIRPVVGHRGRYVGSATGVRPCRHRVKSCGGVAVREGIRSEDAHGSGFVSAQVARPMFASWRRLLWTIKAESRGAIR